MGYTQTREESPITSRTDNSEPVATELTDLPDDSRLEEGQEIGMDEVFDILKNQRRQQVLRYLADADDVLSLGEVAEQIAARENDKPVHQITSQERKRVYVGLYQCHLPKMDDMGAIEFNKPRGRIRPGPAIELFERYLPPEDRDGRTEDDLRRRLPLFSALLVPLVLLVAVWTSSELLLGGVVALLVATVASTVYVRSRISAAPPRD